MKTSVFQFADAGEFLKAVFAQRKSSNPRFSYQVWARRLKLSNASTLWRYVHGKRAVGPALRQQFVRDLGLNEHESVYFELLILSRQAHYDLTGYLKQLQQNDELRKNVHPLSADQFEFVAHWYHMAILEMTSLSEFRGDPEWIRQRLGGRIPIEVCKEAIERLLRLKLLVRDPQRGLARFSDAVLTYGPGLPSTPVRHYHSETIHMALEAVGTQDVRDRYLSGGALSIKKSQLPQLHALIDEMHRKAAESAVSEEADEVYQISTQLYRLTARTGDSA